MPDNSEITEPFADVNLDELSNNLIVYVRKELNSESVNYLEPLTRLTGGYETLICRFQLSGVEERLSNPMIIRLFPENKDSDQALKESIVQNAMAELGYPVPAVHATCTDKAVLGSAFIAMDYVEGETLLDSNMSHDHVFGVLGNLHAEMHQQDPEPIAGKFTEMGWDRKSLTFDSRLEWLRTQVNPNYPWLKVAVEWLFENRPSDPKVLSVCHCDFHPLNILFKDGKIRAVLDWGGFLIGDPAMDVAYASFLSDIALQLISPDLDTEKVKEKYLDAYRKIRPLDETNIAYYSTIKGVQSLLEGVQGHEVWGSPNIVKQLLIAIFEVTGVKIEMPS